MIKCIVCGNAHGRAPGCTRTMVHLHHVSHQSDRKGSCSITEVK